MRKKPLRGVTPKCEIPLSVSSLWAVSRALREKLQDILFYGQAIKPQMLHSIHDNSESYAQLVLNEMQNTTLLIENIVFMKCPLGT